MKPRGTRMSPRQCFGAPPPGLDLASLTGVLIVVEGPDSSGRTTHIDLLANWLEQEGFPVARVGLKRSALVGKELEKAKNGNVLSPRTMSLFYATDFYDQLENRIVPALRAGSVVLADRYIFTPIARDIVRGADAQWLDSLYAGAIVPDAVFYLQVSTRTLVDRTLTSHGGLDYWESGMDLGLSRDWFGSFIHYQRRVRDQFRKLQSRYEFTSVNANASIPTVQAALKDRIRRVLTAHYSYHTFNGGTHHGTKGSRAGEEVAGEEAHSDKGKGGRKGKEPVRRKARGKAADGKARRRAGAAAGKGG